MKVSRHDYTDDTTITPSFWAALARTASRSLRLPGVLQRRNGKSCDARRGPISIKYPDPQAGTRNLYTQRGSGSIFDEALP